MEVKPAALSTWLTAHNVDNFERKSGSLNGRKKWDVNYWKWDGFADNAQYNHFNNAGGADGVPVYSESNHHMTGGYHQMYHVTDLWEAWIDLMETVRKSAKKKTILIIFGFPLHVM